jgi:hypothetical protein
MLRRLICVNAAKHRVRGCPPSAHDADYTSRRSET